MRSGNIRILASGLFTLTIAAAAHAASICSPTVFNASGVFNDSSNLSGTLSIDTTQGKVCSGDLFVDPINSVNTEFTNLVFGGQFVGTPNVWDNVQFVSGGFLLNLDLDLGSANSLVGYSGGQLCPIGDSNCGGFVTEWSLQGTQDPALTSGSLSVAGAPEPSTFLLLAPPIAWIGFRRRRRA